MHKEDNNFINYRDDTTGLIKEKILTSHIDSILSKNKVDDIFKDLRLKNNEDNTDQATDYVNFKFKYAQIQTQISRIKMILNLNMAQGPIYIISLLKLIQFIKIKFALQLERGIEVKIPDKLSQ